MNFKKFLFFCTLFAVSFSAMAKEDSKNDLCKSKIKQLERLIKEADKLNFDTKREEGTIWIAKRFMFFADWDEKNVQHNTYQFGTWEPYRDSSAAMARKLPTFERNEIIKCLDASISELSDVINGDVVRRPVPDIDWANIKFEGDKFVSNGRPVFINDFSSRKDNDESEYLGMTSSGGMSLGSIDYETGELQNSAKSMFKNYNGNSGQLMLGHGSIPKYILNKDPETSIGSRAFTQYDIDNPLIRESWSKVLDVMVPKVKDYKFTDFGYILANEPHFCTEEGAWSTGVVSKHTIEKFKVWLKEKHKSISVLNDLWGSNFESFSDVTIKIPYPVESRTTPMGYDWITFNQDRVTDWFAFLKDGIRKHDKDAIIHIKLIPRIFREDIRDHGIDFETLMNMCDILGNDAKILGRLARNGENPEPWEKYYCFNWYEVGMGYDFFESLAPGKTNINSESHFLSAAGWRDLYLTPEWTRAAYWLATLQGMSITRSWYLPREKDGGPNYGIRRTDIVYPRASGKSYAGSLAQQPAVVNEVSKTYMDLNAFGEEMFSLQSIDRPARIFYSDVSAIKNTTYMERMLDLYLPLYFKGNAVGFVTKNIINTQDIKSWDVTMVRNTEFVTVDEFNALQKYLDNGGTIVIDKVSLKKDEYGRDLNKTLNTSNGKIIYAESVDQFLAKSNEILVANNSKPKISIAESNGTGHDGCVWRSYQKDDNTTVVCIINIGRTNAKLEMTSEYGLATTRNLLTGKSAKNSFEMKPFDILMLEIGHEPDPAYNF